MLTRKAPQQDAQVHRIQAAVLHFIPKLIALYRKGRFPFDRLVKFYGFKNINRAIAGSRRGSTVKPVLRVSAA